MSFSLPQTTFLKVFMGDYVGLDEKEAARKWGVF